MKIDRTSPSTWPLAPDHTPSAERKGQISSSKLSCENRSAETNKLAEGLVYFEKSSSGLSIQRMVSASASKPEDSSDSSFGTALIPSQVYVSVDTLQKNKLSGMLDQSGAIPDEQNLLQTNVLDAHASIGWLSCSRWNINRNTNQGKCESPEKGIDGAFLASFICLLVNMVCTLYIGMWNVFYEVRRHQITDMFIPLFWSIHLFTIEKLRFFKRKWTKRSFVIRDRRRSGGIRVRTLPFAFPIFLAMIILQNVEGSERRQDIINGTVACIDYDNSDGHGVFSLVCPQLDLEHANDFTMSDYITLEKDEAFEGNDNEILLNGEYKGLFKIADSEERAPSSLEDAPIIRNLHLIGGETERDGAFFVQKEQNYFIIDSCSSSGEIKGRNSGGICGDKCSGDILITNCWSSGEISGDDAGGITGQRIAHDGNDYNASVTITLCHSTGNMIGWGNGGITGYWGAENGHLVITDSYSTGNITGDDSGGIVGSEVAYGGGSTTIEQCYSEGEISGEESGGIAGSWGAWGGFLQIKECHSVGEISGDYSGGITGSGPSYDVEGVTTIEQCYSEGKISGEESGGIAGAWGAWKGFLQIKECYSVGEISGEDSGGICGYESAYQGIATIEQCYSLGNISGVGSAGIIAPESAYQGFLVIKECYSVGEISGEESGGIVGLGTAYRGITTIEQCYSEGEISGKRSGGIAGSVTGERGFATIKECYSVGKISGEGSGGITGSETASYDGIVHITNSYSRGEITGAGHAGGVCGKSTGEDDGVVIITNVYTSGSISHADAGGIIGHIDSDAKEINITMSVYNDEPIVGDNTTGYGVLTITKNSGDLSEINGIIYCYENDECWDDETIWEAVPDALPILQFQQLPPSEILPCCTRDSENYLVDCDDCPEHTIFTELQFTQGFLPGAFKDLPASNKSIRILEIRQSDFKKIRSGALEGLDALETLRITDSSLTEVEDGAFAAHDTPNLKNILLARNQLLELPEELFWGIDMDRLDIRGNQIRFIPRNLFQGQQMISLADFRNNHIDFMVRTEEPLSETLFEGTKFLDFFVDGNPGHDECPEGSVPLHKELNMENLEVIMDGFCEIPRCEDSSRFCFATLRPEPTCCLVETDSNSGKQTLKYCKCPDVGVIDLSCHGIEEIAEGAFNHSENYNVTQINLNSNFLGLLRKKAFSGLPSLHTLYLGNNTIASIDDGSFQDIPNLRHLHLDLNKITEIDSLTLNGLFHLETLTAMDNKIEKVGINSFYDTTKIESIYLSRNSLCELPVHGLKSLPNLLEVELMGNPGYQNCTKAGEIYGNGVNVIHLFEQQCLQLIDLEFCFSI